MSQLLPARKPDPEISTLVRELQAEMENSANALSKTGRIKAFFKGSRWREKRLRDDVISTETVLHEIASPSGIDQIMAEARMDLMRITFNLSARLGSKFNFKVTDEVVEDRKFAKKIEAVVDLMNAQMMKHHA